MLTTLVTLLSVATAIPAVLPLNSMVPESSEIVPEATQINFTPSYTQIVAGPLKAGNVAVINYPTSRLGKPACETLAFCHFTNSGAPNCTVTDVAGDVFVSRITLEAGTLNVYAHSWTISGKNPATCEHYDSNYGKNWLFQIAP